MIHHAFVVASVLGLACGHAAATEIVYQKPPQEVLDVLHAPLPPDVSVSPTHDTMILAAQVPFPPISFIAQPALGLAGKRIVPVDEMMGKIRAAVDTRSDPNLLVIGRTDALAIEGIDKAIERMHAYANAGADLMMVLGPYSPDTVARLARETPKPIVYLNSESLTMPMIPAARLHELGINIVVFPLALLLSATRAMERTLAHIKQNGTTLDIIDESMMSWSRFNETMGLDQVKEYERRYGVSA